jgi:hypothetical protein
MKFQKQMQKRTLQTHSLSRGLQSGRIEDPTLVETLSEFIVMKTVCQLTGHNRFAVLKLHV